jgi:hypothetical protein
MSDEMEEKRLALRKACEDINAVLIEASTSNQQKVPTFDLGFSNFLKTLRAERPKVVFLAEARFDSNEIIENIVTDAIDSRIEDDDDLDAEVTRICGIVRAKTVGEMQSVKDNEGFVYLFSARYADHIALRSTSEHADWALEFKGRISDVVEAYVDSLNSDREAVINAKEDKVNAAAEMAIEILMNDPDFRKLKGLPKRCEYVLWKYPQLVARHKHGRLVRVGQNMPMVDAALGDVIRTAHMRAAIVDKVNS